MMRPQQRRFDGLSSSSSLKSAAVHLLPDALLLMLQQQMLLLLHVRVSIAVSLHGHAQQVGIGIIHSALQVAVSEQRGEKSA